MHGKQLTANPLLLGKPSPSPPPLPLSTPPLDPHFLRNPSTLLNERQQPLSVTGGTRQEAFNPNQAAAGEGCHTMCGTPGSLHSRPRAGDPYAGIDQIKGFGFRARNSGPCRVVH